MSELFLLTEEKEVKAFLSFLNKINQVFKTSIEDKESEEFSCYSLTGGKIYSFHKSLLAKMIATPVFAKKEEFFKEGFNSLNLYINGKEFYDFLSEHKKYINGFEQTPEGNLLVKTSLPEVEYKIESLNRYFNKDIELFKTFKDRIYTKYISGKKPVTSYEVDKETVRLITKNEYPTLVTFNTPDDEVIRVKLTKKTLLGLKSTDKFTTGLTLNAYKTSIDDIFVIVANVDNKGYSTKFESKNFFTIINY